MSAASPARRPPVPRAGRPALSHRGRRLARWVQVAAATVGVLVFMQAVFAGHLLTGSSVALTLHEVAGTGILGWLVILQIVAAVLLWRPGRGPGWPALLSVGVLAAVYLQIVFGFAGRLAIHVPNGVAILLVECWIAWRAACLARRPAAPG